MSHFTHLRTAIVDRAHLLAALADLGYTAEEGKVAVRGFKGHKERVDVKVATSTPGYDIGFALVDGKYEVVADWWGIHDLDRNRFVASVTQRYAYRAAVETLGNQGFGLVREEREADGRVHLVLRRMA